MIKFDWKIDEIAVLYETPLLELIFNANQMHRTYHNIGEIQVCYLISIKTGGCPEDFDILPMDKSRGFTANFGKFTNDNAIRLSRGSYSYSRLQLSKACMDTNPKRSLSCLS